jgi:glycosyltransferase involved in cell wall biosynthesis
MIPFLFWKEYSRRIPIDYRCALKLARRQLAEAACVVTISEHSKKDIAELTGYPEERIYVAYLGPPDEREGPNENFGQGISGTKPVRHEPRPYFLYVGGTDYRKNVHFLIRAFARFAQEEQDSQLLLVGETFALRSSLEIAELVREIDRLQIANRVLMMGYVDDRKLQELYRHSVALVFPSLYEGFGLPVLEAMTYGTTVVAARTSSIPEVLGDTGLYFDPRDEESLVAALHTVYDGGDRCKDLIEKAKKRAQLFSWNTLGNVVFEIHQKLERA